jgi:diguanylate cyclase (GGDEF)-like protein
MDALEVLSQVSPREAQQRVQARLDQAKPHSTEAISWLFMKGFLAIESPQGQLPSEILTALNVLQGPNAPLARYMAGMLHAWAIFRSGGNTVQALARARTAEAERPPAMPEYLALRAGYVMTIQLRARGHYKDAANLALENSLRSDRLGIQRQRAAARLAVAAVYIDSEQQQLAKSYTAQGLEIALAAQAMDMVARAYSYESLILGNAPGNDRAFEAAHQALAIARQYGLKRDESLYLANLADFHLGRGNDRAVYEVSKEALALARSTGYTRSENVALTNLGLAEIALGQIERGKRHVEEAVQYEIQRGEMQSAALTYRDLGRQLERVKDWAGAVKAFHEYRRIMDGMQKAELQANLLEQQAQFDAQQQERALQLLKRQAEYQEALLQHGRLQQYLWWLLAALLGVSLAWVALAVRRARASNKALQGVNRELLSDSERDALTGLSNRRHLQSLTARDPAFTQPQGCLFLLDLDRFKSVNDTYGHAAGDALLICAAERLRMALRDQDLLVRWGGEEFLLMVPSAPADQLRGLARRLLNVLGQEPMNFAGQRIPMSASIGYANFPLAPAGLSLPWEASLGLVDAALYVAKARGRNQACGIEAVSAAFNDQGIQLGEDLESAHSRGEITLAQVMGPIRHSADPARADTEQAT